LLNAKTKIVGCGRTDAGVHALAYYAHVDLPNSEIDAVQLTYKLNTLLPASILIKEFIKVEPSAHARFDASERSYVYKMNFIKDPFLGAITYKFDQAGKLNFDLLQSAAKLILKHETFYTFCKTNTEVDNYKCEIKTSNWMKDSDTVWHYQITANRFLRGMVRLIVGMSINVALNRISLDEVDQAMKNSQRLTRAWSVPAHGLYLSHIEYPYI